MQEYQTQMLQHGDQCGSGFLYPIVPHIPRGKRKCTEGERDHQAVSLKIIAREGRILLTQTIPLVEQIISVFFYFSIYPASHFEVQDYYPLCGCL